MNQILSPQMVCQVNKMTFRTCTSCYWLENLNGFAVNHVSELFAILQHKKSDQRDDNLCLKVKAWNCF